MITPFLLTADYYFSKEKVRPYIGLTGGFARRSDLDVNVSPGQVFIGNEAEVEYDISPRLGLNAGHFRINVAYHITGGDIQDFLTIGFGFDFGVVDAGSLILEHLLYLIQFEKCFYRR